MIASLGMYDRAELAPANDALWALIRDGLRARGQPAPESLTRGEGAFWPAWESADLVLSQTCGLPFRAALHDRVTLIATPDYQVEGCPKGYYRSVLIARADDARDDEAAFATARMAVNEQLSQSGWAAAHAHFQALGLTLANLQKTGGHLDSARAVAEGRADFAAVDAVSWRLLTRYEGFASRLKVWGQTQPAPGLPLIARAGADARATFDAVADAITALPQHHRDSLGLYRVVQIPASAYLTMPLPPAIA